MNGMRIFHDYDYESTSGAMKRTAFVVSAGFCVNRSTWRLSQRACNKNLSTGGGMMRIVQGRRRYGAGSADPSGISAGNLIKDGFDAGGTDADPRGKNRDGPFPGKLLGFCLFRDSYGPDGKKIIDFPAMKVLGYSEDKIRRAMELQLKAPEGLLPTTLNVTITNNAKKGEDGRWEYPATFGELYKHNNSSGLFCKGDGLTAWRKLPDGTGREEIPCVPADCGPDPCEYSVGKDAPCKINSRFACCVYKLGEDGREIAVDATLGFSAKWAFDTKSAYSPQSITDALDAASDRTNGFIGGLTGILSFSRRKRRLGQSKGQRVGLVPHVFLTLNEQAIAHRVLMLRSQIEAPAAPKEIEAPESEPNPEVTKGRFDEFEAPSYEGPRKKLIPKAQFSDEELPDFEGDLPPEDPEDPEVLDPPENGFDPLSLDNKTDEQIVESIGAFLLDRCHQQGRKVEEVAIDFLWLDRGGNRTAQKRVKFFLEAKGAAQDAIRRKALREIAQRMLDNHVEGFEILTMKAAGL